MLTPMRFPRFLWSLLVPVGLIYFAQPGVLSAQNASPSPGPGGNLFGDQGGFEKIAGTDDNVWDGVNSEGTLAVPTFSAKVVTERNALGDLAMPPSVAYADLNGDGKPDLLVAAPNGYFYYYQNRGTAAEPRFTNAEIVPLFLSMATRAPGDYRAHNVLDTVRFCPRISLAEWRNRGIFDLIVGNYLGELFFIPNQGSQRASFRQPVPVESARVATADANRLWGNLLSPVAADWSGKGRLDLLLGEGTYSANAIRLLENAGGSAPKFPSAGQSFLAYGDGREQLIPAVVDYNGDGKPDLLISDRTREIGVYLNNGKPGGAGELARSSTISFGGSGKLPGFAAPCVADFNGDGLFDLLFGLDNGHIAVALNTGTKEQPKFGPPRDLKGEDRLGRNVKRPVGWETWTKTEFGNALAYFTVVNAQDDPASAPPEGANCLKAGYWPVANDVFPLGQEGIPGTVRQFSLLRRTVTLEQGKNYAFSFKVKNNGMEKLHYRFRNATNETVGALREETDDRGFKTVATADRMAEVIDVGADFTAGGNWTTVTKTINVRYKSSEFQTKKEITGSVQVDFDAHSMADTIYFDDFQMVPAK